MAAPHVEIVVENAISDIIERVGRDAFVQGLEDRLGAYVERLGLDGALSASVTRGGQRAVSVRVRGRTLSYPPSFLGRLWFGLASHERSDAAAGSALEGDFPDRWLCEQSRRVLDDSDGEGIAAVAELVAQLVVEAIAVQPSALLTAASAATLLPEPVVDDGDAVRLFTALFDLGVAPTDRERIGHITHGVLTVGRSVTDTLEEVFAALRARSLRVEVSPEVYAALVEDDGGSGRITSTDERVRREVKDMIKVVYDYRLEELGLRAPLEFVRADQFERPEIKVGVNDWTSPPIPIVNPEEVAAGVSPRELGHLGIEARPIVDPITGRESSAVHHGDAKRVEEARFLVVPSVGYMAAAFARAVIPNAHRMIGIDDVEEDLATIEAELPVLVHATLARHGIGEITRVLRALVREQVSIRDLRRILDVLLLYSETTPDDLDAMFPDDPLPAEGDPPTPVWSSWIDPRLLAFVRARLRDRVCYDNGLPLDGSRAVDVHETDGAFEGLIEELLAAQDVATADRLVNVIREGVWNALGDGATREPIIITAARYRLALRRAIELELPATHVIARAEVAPMVRLHHLDSVTVPAAA